ncbi:MAG: CRISPR-associated helicase Cas3' [Nitrososphaeria archaeon]
MLSKYYQEILEKKGYRSRKYISNTIDLIAEEWRHKNIFFIEAPTGYGKSTIAQAISTYSVTEELKSIVVLPIRTLLEDQFAKFKEVSPNEQILGKRYMHNADSRYLIKPITLTTIDTLSLSFFGIPPEDLDKVVKKFRDIPYGSVGHYMFSISSIMLSNIILDEVHLLADSTKSLNFLILLMHLAIDNDQKLFLMSATIPKALEEKIMSYKNGLFRNSVTFMRFEKGEDSHFYDREFIEERRKKNYMIFVHNIKSDEEKFEKILDWIEENKEFRRIIIVFNTVKDAIAFYELVVSKRVFENIILLHSRFNEKDRIKKTSKLKEIKDKESYLIVSTQVIEAGVDISSNLFLSEIAPANSLIQRLGRFLRYEQEDRGIIHIWFQEGEDGNLSNHENKYTVYDYQLTQKTLEKLKEICSKRGEDSFYTKSEDMNFHDPQCYRKLIDFVYSPKDFQISEDKIEDFINILLQSDKLSIKAVEKFFELEGSFVREEALVSVISSDILRQLEAGIKTDYPSLSTISEYFVPISIRSLVKLAPKEVVYLRNEKGHVKLEKESVPGYVFGKLEPRELLKYTFSRQSAAFVVDTRYDEQIGLEVGE